MELRKKLSSSSIATYQRVLQALDKACIDTDNAQAIMQHASNRSPAAQNTILNACIHRHGRLAGLQAAAAQARKDMQQQYQRTALTPAQTSQQVTWQQVLAHRDSLPDGLEKLMLTLYTRLPPIRRDYADVLVVEQHSPEAAQDHNYYCRHSTSFVMHIYKTAKHSGTKIKAVPADVAAMIEQSLQDSPRRWLLQTRSGRPFTRNHLTQYMSRLMPGCRLSTSLLRKLARTEWAKAGYDSSKKLAWAMDHSESTANHYYNNHKVLDASSNTLGIHM